MFRVKKNALQVLLGPIFLLTRGCETAKTVAMRCEGMAYLGKNPVENTDW